MPRKKRVISPFELYDDDYDEDASSQGSRNGQPPVQRNAANARERMRMRVLSSAYGRLKTKLPNIPPDTKLSKLDTLRLATLYIKQLIAAVENGTTVSADIMDTSQLAETGGAFTFHHAAAAAAQGMSWPFEFHHIQNANRHLTYNTTRMDNWQHTSATQSHELVYSAKMQRGSHDQHTNINYAQPINETHGHWYGELNNNNNAAGCIYDSMNNAQNTNCLQQLLQHQQQQQHN